MRQIAKVGYGRFCAERIYNDKAHQRGATVCRDWLAGGFMTGCSDPKCADWDGRFHVYGCKFIQHICNQGENMEKQIDKMVDRFLCWKLPKDFSPDCGISFDGRQDDELTKNKTWPVGTNLLTAEQAKQMFEYCLGLLDGCEHEWVSNSGRGGNPVFRLNRQMNLEPLMQVRCEQCGTRSWMNEEQWLRWLRWSRA